MPIKLINYKIKVTAKDMRDIENQISELKKKHKQLNEDLIVLINERHDYYNTKNL